MGAVYFLDEIGELPLEMQAKLLRAIQEQIIRPVGGVDDIQVHLRLITATNRDLEQKIKEETFRKDLYYRLNVIQIHLAPLRERKEDISLLVQHFVEKYSQKMQKKQPSISSEAMLKMESYAYPGNVRELEHLIERTLVLTDTHTHPVLLPEDLPPVLQEDSQGATATDSPLAMESTYKIQFSEAQGLDLEETLGNIEKDILTQALKISHGIKKKAAKLLRMSSRSFRYRLSKHDLYSEDEGEEDMENATEDDGWDDNNG